MRGNTRAYNNTDEIKKVQRHTIPKRKSKEILGHTIAQMRYKETQGHTNNIEGKSRIARTQKNITGNTREYKNIQ